MKTWGKVLFVSLLIFCPASFSQIQLMSSGYAQDFNTLSDTGSSSELPAGWYLLETGTAADSQYTASTGSTTGGNTYSYGSTESTERALGSQRAGTLIPVFGARFVNNTGGVITLLHITYWGEQWRAGVKNRNEADTLIFEYSLDASSLSDGNWNRAAGLNLLSPNINSSSNALDGNSTENRREIGYTITGLAIPQNAEFWIRWQDADISGVDDGLAIDDLFIDFTPPAVIFSITPLSLNFDTVNVGNSASLTVSVENKGTTDNLVISNMESANPVFSFSPDSLPVSISPGNSQEFNIIFTPAAGETETGTVNFIHNAEGSPFSLPVIGTGYMQAQSGILKFKSAAKNFTEGTLNIQDTIVLNGYSGQPLKAIQFNLLIGKSNGGLKLKSVSRGNAVPENQFNLSYEIYPGSLRADSSSIDTVKVVILGNGTNVINPDAGNQEIMYFIFDAVNISGDSLQTFNSLTGVKGATAAPVADANISSGADEIINISAYPPPRKFGDLNLDEHVDLLDILLMIDCILGRVVLNTGQFANGDIFPWTLGESAPAGDGIIDVLDLALLHNTVLTGKYPDDVPVPKIITGPVIAVVNNGCRGFGETGTKLTFRFTREGISIDLKSDKKIKGLQAELANVGSVIPANTAASSSFNKAEFYQENSVLRLLAYDDQSTPLQPGSHLAASIRFALANPEDIVIEDIIAADETNKSVEDMEIEIQYENLNLPLSYMLGQNYPNPFNPATVIKFALPENEFVIVKVYNIMGQEVKTLFNGNANAGFYTLSWDGKDNWGMKVSSGTYIYSMTAGSFIESKKMIYLK